MCTLLFGGFEGGGGSKEVLQVKNKDYIKLNLMHNM
jgi:hypothetical protein